MIILILKALCFGILIASTLIEVHNYFDLFIVSVVSVAILLEPGILNVYAGSNVKLCRLVLVS